MPSSALPDYAELFSLSNYTFLRGASHPEELVERAAHLGYRALALADECSVAGLVKAHIEAKKHRLHLIAGASFSVQGAGLHPPLQLVLLAKTREGYGNLCELISQARQRAPKGQYQLSTAHLDGSAPDAAPHLAGMPGCLALVVPTYNPAPSQLEAQVSWATACFKNRCHLVLALLHRAHDAQHQNTVYSVADRYHTPLLASSQAEMHLRSRKPLHDALCAIRQQCTIAQSGFNRAPNAEQHLRSRLRLANLYPAPLLEATVALAAQCRFNLDQLHYHYPHEPCPAGTLPATWLRQQTFKGARWRYPDGLPENIRQQLEYELQLIAELRYEPYFLTVYDIVRFARQRGILCQGRGSAANSAVCYCLGITEVDPGRGNSLFERFISKERNEPPDIDVDFEHHRREEVIQYIYTKYGRHRAALAAAVITYRSKSALRDTGKALGVDATLINQLAPLWHYSQTPEQQAGLLRQCGLPADSTSGLQWLQLATLLAGFPRHLSQHPGGFVISEEPLHHLVPIENAAMTARSVIQWSKDDLDALGILKIDILALGMLSVIRRALNTLSHYYQRPFQMHDIPPEDPATYNMLCQADAIGVFQIESRAQMSMLARLQPRTFYDLVIQIAIVRPGPIQGGMVHPYLRRRKGLEKVSYPGKALQQALGRTLGVPIFQEQVMQIAMLAAGFSAGQADELRRAMAAWRRKGTLEKFRHKLLAGMLAHGYSSGFAEQLFKQIQGFGEYGFPESHSASFALLAYASAWLKCHEPAAFLAALLNSQPMGFYSPASLVQDAQRHQVCVLPPDIRHSVWQTTLEPPVAPNTPSPANPAVRLGFNQIKGLSAEAAKKVEQARLHGPFTSISDLASRAGLNRQQVQALAASGALNTLSGSRRSAQWEALVAAPDKGLLQSAPVIETEYPDLASPTPGQDVIDDYQAMGLSLNAHPLALLRPHLTRAGFSSAAQLRQQPNRRISRACGLVIIRQRPATAHGVVFVTLEDETGQVNLIVRPELAQRQRCELLQARLLGAYGSWQAIDQVHHLQVDRLVDLSSWLGKLQNIKSRDFQ